MVCASGILFALCLPVTSFGARAQILESHKKKGSVDQMEQQIIAKEREGLECLKTGDLSRFGRLTADNAILVDDHGPAGKTQVMKNVAEFKLLDFSMDDVRFVPISAKSGLITYEIHEHGESHGHEFTAQAYVSSVWEKRGKDWVCLFSQETATK